jgi:hypothetical protein
MYLAIALQPRFNCLDCAIEMVSAALPGTNVILAEDTVPRSFILVTVLVDDNTDAGTAAGALDQHFGERVYQWVREADDQQVDEQLDMWNRADVVQSDDEQI